MIKIAIVPLLALLLVSCNQTPDPAGSVPPIGSAEVVEAIVVVAETEPTPAPPAPSKPKRQSNLYELGPWINSEPIESLETLEGRVILVKFWTFGCHNCPHTLPYVQAWHKKYEDQGLTILGIHSPEFAYERKLENVQASVNEYGLTFPIALDNDFKTWWSFNNRY